MTRDANGDVSELEGSHASGTFHVKFVLDHARRVIEESETTTWPSGAKDTATIRYGYDDAGRYLGSTNGGVRREYDKRTGRVMRTREPINDGIQTTAFSYDDQGRVTRLETESNPSYDEQAERVTEYEYRQRRAELRHPGTWQSSTFS